MGLVPMNPVVGAVAQPVNGHQTATGTQTAPPLHCQHPELLDCEIVGDLAQHNEVGRLIEPRRAQVTAFDLNMGKSGASLPRAFYRRRGNVRGEYAFASDRQQRRQLANGTSRFKREGVVIPGKRGQRDGVAIALILRIAEVPRIFGLSIALLEGLGSARGPLACGVNPFA